MLRAILLATLVALLAATAATAATPAQYRAKVNGICRSYTPQLKRLADKNALQELLELGRAQDKKIEAVPVPAAMRKTMAPILARLRKIDVQVDIGLKAAKNGDEQTLFKAAAAIAALSAPLDRWLDAAGLSYCGSKQQ